MKSSASGTTVACGLTAISRYRATLCVAVALLGGCGRSGSPHAAISGRVTVNGKEVEQGKIAFLPRGRGNGQGESAEIHNGEYRLTAVPLGKNTFTFSGAVLTGKTIPGPGGQPEPERLNCIPRTVLRDGVEREISGDGTQDFTLQGEP